MQKDLTIKPIGVIHSCYKEKFTIPRQPLLVTAATAELELLPPYDREEALRGLEDFSHLWIQFIFHKHLSQGDNWKPVVRPPRLDGKKLGVFATRSTFRPNPLGLSVVRYHGYEKRGRQIFLKLSGIDMLDRTPVVDIKPYLPYADSLSDAKGGFTEDLKEHFFNVCFEPAAEKFLAHYQKVPQLRLFLEQLLRLDPRPTCYKSRDKGYAAKVFDVDVKWRIEDDKVIVETIVPLKADSSKVSS